MPATIHQLSLAAALACALLAVPARLAAQAEVMPWGSVPGIRVEGQLMPVGATVCSISTGGAAAARTARERQRPRFTRTAVSHSIVSALGPLSFTEKVSDTGRGAANVELAFTADSASTLGGGLCIDLDGAAFGDASVQLIGATGDSTARGLRIASRGRTLEIAFSAPAAVAVRNSGQQNAGGIALTIGVLRPGAASGSTAANRFAITTSGPLDHAPVELSLQPDRPGRAFAGLGGNFRIQNPRTDPQVVAYNLENLRVAWGRVEMPWRDWDPDESADPTIAANAGRLDERVTRALEMAKTLGERKIPVVVSVWFPPAWAVVGELRTRPSGGVWGNALDPAKQERIYASITSYLLYLKTHYGVEAALFSFNESDLGIDVRQTGEEHAAFIRGLGAYMASHGLATKMLLGDTSDATATDFIGPAMREPATWPYIGAVSYHSWRGWSDELLSFWGDAAKKLNVPLLVGEGSTDAAAWNYPAVFQEPWFAMEEINLYTRMLALSEPLSILQWQLTADYSVLAGGGIFGDSTALRPTQRFWNLKQFASTPPDAVHLPVSCARASVTCAAVADTAAGAYVVHIVNNGASRPATLTGLPAEVKELRLYLTDATHGMREGARVPVSAGRAEFTLAPNGFTSLMGSRAVSSRP